jgi:hypothetical protein
MSKADFDFRHPQNKPWVNDGKIVHQYLLKGSVKWNSDTEITLYCEGIHDYLIRGNRMIGDLNHCYYGEGQGVKARWVQIDVDRFLGTWIEDGVELLFMAQVEEE